MTNLGDNLDNMMYPYVNVLSKDAFDLLTQDGKNTEVLESQGFSYEVVSESELPDKLFGHAVVMQAHLIEVFDVDDIPYNDIIIADSDVEEISGYQDVTDLLNESFEILEIPYEYPMKIFVPENIEVVPRRFEYAYINVPLFFSFAISLYRAAMIHFETCDKVVLLKYKYTGDEG